MRFLKSDIPFARDDAQRFLPVIVAVMVAVAALLLACGLSFAGSLSAQQRDATGTLQVQLTVPEKDRQKATDDAVAILKATRGVKRITVLKSDEVADMLEPWLGEREAVEQLSLPVMIEVATRAADGAAFDTKALEQSLRTRIKQVRVETPITWLQQLAQVLRVAQASLMLLALLLLTGLVGLAVLISRVALRLHFKTVNLLHLFGATDEYILKQFQRHNAVMVARGALIGSTFAALLMLSVHLATHDAENPILPQVAFSGGHIALFILLPVFISLVAMLATRFTVQAMLQRMH